MGGLLWIRKCPQCEEDIFHRNFHSAKTCHKQKRLCYTCGSWNKGLTKKTNVSIKNMSLKVSASMKKMRETIPPWNLGLSKDTNDILKNMGEQHMGHKHTDETKKVIGDRSRELWKDPAYRDDVIRKVKSIIGNPAHIAQWRLKMEQNGYFTPLSLKSAFRRYKDEVWCHTRKNDLKSLENYDKRGRSNYHLDHKYSITRGFLNNIPSEIVGSYHNLRMLHHKDNIRKNSKCSITKEELLEKYYGVNKNKIQSGNS